MILLAFAFLAGFVTVLAPCILPILPIILSGGVVQGKRRPWGIILGVVLSFSFFTLTLSWLVQHAGLSPNFSRHLGIAILGALGVVLVVPAWLDRFEGWMSSRFNGLQPNANRHGFGGGIVLGISLGAVWTPCAGPILASVVAASQTGQVNGTLVGVTFAYAAGAALPMGLIAALGQRIAVRIRWLNTHLRQIQTGFGVVLLIVTALMVTNTDRRLQAWIISVTPNWLPQLQRFEERAPTDGMSALQPSGRGANRSTLSNFGPAPELTGITGWLNSQPLSLAELRGQVVLVKFWTYSCINCIRTFPAVQSWYDRYHDRGFEILAVHTPEFEFEKIPSNVQQAVNDYRLPYPVALDPEYATWRAYRNRYWPAKYLIDAEGDIRYVHFGEGRDEETERAIQQLLDEAGRPAVEPIEAQPGIALAAITPETYFGRDRMERLVSPEPVAPLTEQVFSAPRDIPSDRWAFAGGWSVTGEYAAASPGASIRMNVTAKNVYVVMTPSDGGPAPVEVTIDGDPISEVAIQGGVDAPTLYRIADFPNLGSHLLEVRFPAGGTQVYAATFGSVDAAGITCGPDGKCTVENR